MSHSRETVPATPLPEAPGFTLRPFQGAGDFAHMANYF